MYLNILDSKRVNLIKELNSISFIKNFSMGGGTALSLQLGLRKSYDFVFFARKHFDPELLLSELISVFGNRMQIINQETRVSTLDLYIDEIQVSFFEFNCPLLDNKITIETAENITLLSVKDIACMKAVAIAQRGSRKDFYDLYFILKDRLLDIKTLKSDLLKKYNDDNFISNFCYSMTYFDDADEDILPQSFVPYNWDEIKKFYLKAQSDFYKLI